MSPPLELLLKTATQEMTGAVNIIPDANQANEYASAVCETARAYYGKEAADPYCVPLETLTKAAAFVESATNDLGEQSRGVNKRAKPDKTVTILPDDDKSGKKAKIGSKPNARANPKVSRDTFSGVRPMIGEELIPSLSSNRLTGIVLKAGTKLHRVDHLSNFFSNLMQSGSVSSQWGGTLATKTDVSGSGHRTYFCTNFRHRFSSNTLLDPSFPADWPASTGTKVMSPAGANTPLPYGMGTTTGPVYVHALSEDCYAPINRADLEDMSWNLNKLKLINNKSNYQQNIDTNTGQLVGGSDLLPATGAPMFAANVASADPTHPRHYRMSRMQDNNAYQGYDLSDNSSWVESVYKYNMVFKGGNVCYQFHNPITTACRVEVVVYRMKKGMSQSDDITVYGESPYGPLTPVDPDGSCLNNVVYPIQQGYVETVVGKRGTELLGGRVPQQQDVTTNPEFPFLPQTKKIVQKGLRFKEVMRTAFAMPAGSNRTCDIALEGIVYDPVNVPDYVTPQYLDPPGNYNTVIPALKGQGILDEHSYCVVISVCGVKMARDVKDPTITNGPNSTIVGNVHCPAKIEYLCTYREDIAACQYKRPGPTRIYNQALSADTLIGANAGIVVSAQTVVPVNQSVRTTADGKVGV